MEFVLETRANAAPVVHLTFGPDESADVVHDALALATNAGEDATLWLHGTTEERRELVESTGRTTNRTLLQMRCPLPTPTPTLATRPFLSLIHI